MASNIISAEMLSRALWQRLEQDNYSPLVYVGDNIENQEFDIWCQIYGGEFRMSAYGIDKTTSCNWLIENKLKSQLDNGIFSIWAKAA